MHIIVTGAAGFVGGPLVALLAAQGHQVTPVVRKAAQMAHEVIVPSIDGQSQWGHLLSGCDVVIHLAARAHVMREQENDPVAAYRSINVAGTMALAQQAAAAGVKRFVFISSVKVNGEGTVKGQPFRPEDIPAPEDAYAHSKLEAEQCLREISNKTDMEIVIIRPPLVYGPGVKGNFATMIKLVRKGVPLPLGAIYNQRSMIALDNLVDFIALCASLEQSAKAANETFLIADGPPISTTLLLRKIAMAYGVKQRLLPVPAFLLQIAARLLGRRAIADRLCGSLILDSSKAQAILAWTPVISMDQQLQKMALHDTLA